MATPQAEKAYLAQHVAQRSDKGYAVYNPHGLPLEDLPTIWGFNNSDSAGWLCAQLLADDGTPLGEHVCSHEGYMAADLGVLEGTRADRHEEFKAHYPRGYKMDFVSLADRAAHAGLAAAVKRYDDREQALSVARKPCKARQYSDQMQCLCGLAWDVNDPEPPHCPEGTRNGR